jgi:glycogen synthase
MPSVSEPFGLTPLEAIGFGTPALVTKQSGVSEVMGNVLKVDFWDIDEMANQITAVVQNDPLRDNLLENAQREYRHLSWENASHKIVHVYHQHAGAVA